MTTGDFMTDLPLFDGRTFKPSLDLDRLGEQYRAVFRLMADGQWRTLAEIEALT